MNLPALLVRKSELSDILEIQRLYRQLDRHHATLLPEVFQVVDGDARSDEFVRKLMERKDATYLLAEFDKAIIGFISVQKSARPKYPSFREHEFAMIEDAVVDELHRGKGIGTKLFAAAVDWAKMCNLRYIQTSVWHNNEGARKFYLEQGFRPQIMRLELDTESAT